MLARLLVLAALAVAAPAASAQTAATNAEVLQRLAVRCLAATPDTARAFRLALPPAHAYLRPALLDRWTADGRAVYPDEGAAPEGLPRLSVTVRNASVAYERQGRDVARTARLVVAHTLSAPDGRLLGEHVCLDRAEDVVPRDALPSLSDPSYASTQAALPPGRVRRYAAPAVFAAATVVSAFLLFSLRSE